MLLIDCELCAKTCQNKQKSTHAKTKVINRLRLRKAREEMLSKRQGEGQGKRERGRDGKRAARDNGKGRERSRARGADIRERATCDGDHSGKGRSGGSVSRFRVLSRDVSDWSLDSSQSTHCSFFELDFDQVMIYDQCFE